MLPAPSGRRRFVTGAAAALVLSLLAPIPATGGIVGPACLRSSEAVGSAKTKLAYARQAERRARTKAETRRAAAQTRRAEKIYAKAYKRRDAACANKPPRFPASTTYSLQTDTEPFTNAPVTWVILSTPARDPDGDLLEYRWETTSGSIVHEGTAGKWSRETTAGGMLAGGTVTVTVYDGATAKPNSFSITIADGEQ